jgi:membrane protease subunit HflK
MTHAETPPTMQATLRRTVRFTAWILGGLVVTYLFSGIFSVAPSELGVVLRFGKVLDASVPPGIHYALPWPVDRVIRVPVRTVMRLSVDDFSESSEVAYSFRALTGLSSYLLTGDNNIVSARCVLQYSVQDPARYLFSLGDSERSLRSLASNTLIHCLSQLTIDDILTTGKTGIQQYVKTELQRRLDELDSGLAITFVELQDVKPPQRVEECFNDVINAKIDKDKAVNNALSYRNEKIPKAQADSDRLIRDAEAYQDRVITRAKGDAERFLSQLVEYRRSPELTRKRLHLELLNEILPKQKGASIVAQEDGHPVARIIVPRGK